MGIPILFNFFKSNCKSVSYDVKQCPEFDNLFFDLNIVVYQACNDLNNNLPEIKKTDHHYQCALFKRFFQIINDVLDYVKPQKRIYLAFDGCSPRAKFQTQLSRRIDYLENINYVSNSNIKFTSCLLAPGTQMMLELNDKLNTFITESLLTNPKYVHNAIYYSGFNDYGEGEFKVFKFIKIANIFNERNIIFGRDTDYVIYGLANSLFNLRVLSYSTNLSEDESTNNEKINFKLNCINVENNRFECDYMNLVNQKMQKLDYQNFEHLEVRKIYDYLKEIFSDISNLDESNLIRDLILVFILLGTDFTISMPYLYKIADPLKLIRKYHNYLKKNRSAYLTKEDGLNLNNFSNFISLINHDLLSKFNSSRNLKTIKIEFYKKELNIKDGKPGRKCLEELTSDYLFALFWNLKLYYTDILSWNFKMKKFPPFIDDLEINETVEFDKIRDNSQPLLPLTNLVHITPYQSFDILPIIYQSSLKYILNKPETNRLINKCFYYNLNLNTNSKRDKYYDKINKIIDKLNEQLDQNEKLRNEQGQLKLFRIFINKC